MKKKIVALCLCVALAVVAIGGATLAYFTDTTETKENVFTVGNVDITLTEPEWDKTGSKDAETVYAGEPLAKDPTVENTGDNACFVRIKVTNLDCLKTAKVGGMIVYRNAAYAVGQLNENWFDGKDGYFYYTKVLENKGDKTTPAFSSIVIPTDLKGDANNTSFHVDVFAEAVQAQGARPSFAAVKAMTPEQIQVWFNTVMATENPVNP